MKVEPMEVNLSEVGCIEERMIETKIQSKGDWNAIRTRSNRCENALIAISLFVSKENARESSRALFEFFVSREH